MEKYQRLPPKARLTPKQEQAMVEARVTFMTHCPFFAYYYYDQLVEYPTYAVPTAATDGKRVYYNPDYLLKLRPPERCFVLAHETYHAVWGHSKRMRYYRTQGTLEGLPFFPDLFNTAADYVINADLIANNIGLCNPNWLFNASIAGTDKIEKVYKRLFKAAKIIKVPKPPAPGEPCEDGEPNEEDQVVTETTTYGRGSQPDKKAAERGGRFDEVQEPWVNPVTAVPDEVSDIAHAEAVARALDAAKAIGKVPGFIQRLVNEVLEPQVPWRDKVRQLIVGRIGRRREDWRRPNRRRLVLNPLVIMPGKRGFGCDLIAVWIDNSGSVGKGEYNAFFSEIGGILVDVKPKRLLVGWCDAEVRRTEWASSLEEWQDHNYKPTPGGGGTDFRPPFRWMNDNEIHPDQLIYLTDMYGPFPGKPDYAVIWCATTDIKGPFGETVRIYAR